MPTQVSVKKILLLRDFVPEMRREIEEEIRKGKHGEVIKTALEGGNDIQIGDWEEFEQYKLY